VSWRFVDIDGVRVVVTPVWDGQLMHAAERLTTVIGTQWILRCMAPYAPPHYGLQVVENATPTCIWCIVDRRRA
jgi:hypothetical protein